MLAKYEGEILQLSHTPQIYNNLQTLRSKYNIILELTAKLTIERDQFLSQYQVLRKQYYNITSQVNVSSDHSFNTPRIQRKRKDITIQQGFSFLSLVIVAAGTFILTRYIQAKFSIQDEDL